MPSGYVHNLSAQFRTNTCPQDCDAEYSKARSSKCYSSLVQLWSELEQKASQLQIGSRHG